MILPALESRLIGITSVIHVLASLLLAGPLRAKHAATQPATDGPILVIRCEAKIGDNLLHIPFLRALRHAFPERAIHLLHHRAARAIYERCPYIDKRMEIDWDMSNPKTLLHRISLCREVFSRDIELASYAMALVPRWDEDLYAPFLAWFSKSPYRLGFSSYVFEEKQRRNIGTNLLFSEVIDDRAVEHESRRPLQLIDRLQPRRMARSNELEFWFSPDDLRALRSRLSHVPGFGSSWVAMAPGAAIGRRQWPVEHFAQVAQALLERKDMRVVVLGTASEAIDCERLCASLPPGRSLNLAGQLSLPECAALLAQRPLFIGNDSGLMHMACAMGAAVLEISCHPQSAPALHPNSPARFGPLALHSAVLRPARPLAPVCGDGCSFDHVHCIASVPVEEAINAALALLGAHEATIRAEAAREADERSAALPRGASAR